MATLQTILGPHAYIFQRYGIPPHLDVREAAERLSNTAPHLARLLRDIAYRNEVF
ncbi:MAG: hypothetical protein ACP5J0_01230 [Pyrobaculum sp.]